MAVVVRYLVAVALGAMSVCFSHSFSPAFIVLWLLNVSIYLLVSKTRLALDIEDAEREAREDWKDRFVAESAAAAAGMTGGDGTRELSVIKSQVYGLEYSSEFKKIEGN